MRRSPWLSVLVLAVLAVLPAAARATTVLKLPVEEMTRRADLVVRGEVTDVAVRSDDRNRPLATVVTFRVSDVLKGQPTSPVLRLELVGGSNAEHFSRVAGMPGFRPGEEVVLFLEKTPWGFIPMGLSQGKYTVQRDVAGRARALREVPTARVVRDTQGRYVTAEGADPEDDLPLADLVKAVARGLRREGGAR